MKLQGAEAIADYMDNDVYYTDLSVLLKVFNAPKELNKINVPSFCITTEQADKMKKMIIEMREVMK